MKIARWGAALALTAVVLTACATTEMDTEPARPDEALHNWKRCASKESANIRNGYMQEEIERQREEIWLRCLWRLEPGQEQDALKLLRQEMGKDAPEAPSENPREHP